MSLPAEAPTAGVSDSSNVFDALTPAPASRVREAFDRGYVQRCSFHLGGADWFQALDTPLCHIPRLEDTAETFLARLRGLIGEAGAPKDVKAHWSTLCAWDSMEPPALSAYFSVASGIGDWVWVYPRATLVEKKPLAEIGLTLAELLSAYVQEPYPYNLVWGRDLTHRLYEVRRPLQGALQGAQVYPFKVGSKIKYTLGGIPQEGEIIKVYPKGFDYCVRGAAFPFKGKPFDLDFDERWLRLKWPESVDYEIPALRDSVLQVSRFCAWQVGLPPQELMEFNRRFP